MRNSKRANRWVDPDRVDYISKKDAGNAIRGTPDNRGFFMTKIKGQQDGPGGRNDHYDIGPRKNIPRNVLVKEVKKGKHPGVHVMKRNGRQFVRDNPDSSTKDNVNR